jgi:hypothetical protein
MPNPHFMLSFHMEFLNLIKPKRSDDENGKEYLAGINRVLVDADTRNSAQLWKVTRET